MPINNRNNEDYYNKTQFHVMKVTTHAASIRFQYDVVHVFRNPHRSTKVHVCRGGVGYHCLEHVSDGICTLSDPQSIRSVGLDEI